MPIPAYPSQPVDRGGASRADASADQPDPSRWLTDHGDAMWRYAIAQIKDPDQTEELIQETLVAALAAGGRFRAESTERTWLVSILQHKIVDHIRRRRRAGPDARVAAWDEGVFDAKGKWLVSPRAWPRNPDQALADPEFRRDYEACLRQLPVGLAEAFELRDVREQGAGAVCVALSITANNLWVRLHRARALLRRCLAAKWSPDSKERC